MLKAGNIFWIFQLRLIRTYSLYSLHFWILLQKVFLICLIAINIGTSWGVLLTDSLLDLGVILLDLILLFTKSHSSSRHLIYQIKIDSIFATTCKPCDCYRSGSLSRKFEIIQILYTSLSIVLFWLVFNRRIWHFLQDLIKVKTNRLRIFIRLAFFFCSIFWRLTCRVPVRIWWPQTLKIRRKVTNF